MNNKKFFPVRMVGPWNRSATEVVEVSKARLEQRGTVEGVPGVELDDLQGPSKLKPFHDSVISCFTEFNCFHSKSQIQNIVVA